MRSNCFRSSIAHIIVGGICAMGPISPWVQAQSAGQDKVQRYFSYSTAAQAVPTYRLPPASAESSVRSSVSLSPAVVTVTCKMGQSYTQTLTITNQTEQELVFEMIAEDVVVRDGKRVFVAAG